MTMTKKLQIYYLLYVDTRFKAFGDETRFVAPICARSLEEAIAIAEKKYPLYEAKLLAIRTLTGEVLYDVYTTIGS